MTMTERPEPRVHVITIPERVWFTPSTAPRMTGDELLAFARVAAWAGAADADPMIRVEAELRCPCCCQDFLAGELVEHVMNPPRSCDRTHWGFDASADLVVGLD